MWKRIKAWWRRKWCPHDNFDVVDVMGPTNGRHKTWVSCKCRDCGQHFVYERLSGRRHLTDRPGFGFKAV